LHNPANQQPKSNAQTRFAEVIKRLLRQQTSIQYVISPCTGKRTHNKLIFQKFILKYCVNSNPGTHRLSSRMRL